MQNGVLSYALASDTQEPALVLRLSPRDVSGDMPQDIDVVLGDLMFNVLKSDVNCVKL